MSAAIPPSEFAQLVAATGAASEDACNHLLAEHNGDFVAVLDLLARKEPGRKSQLGRMWGDRLGVAYIDMETALVHPALVQRVPEAFAKENRVLPLYEFGGVITLATPTPTDADFIKRVENQLDTFVSAVFALPSEIDTALEMAYLTGISLCRVLEDSDVERLDPEDGDGGTVTAERLARLSGDKAIIDFTRGLILLATRQNASDIHIEPAEHRVRVRFRVDGVLREVFSLEPRLLAPVVTRLKVMAQVDIAEQRRPQDGHVTVLAGSRQIEIRMATMPTIYGEKVVLRLLAQAGIKAVPDLADLDCSARTFDDLRAMLGLPNGILFVTGPTGSGKTTTLYAMLRLLNKPGVNIVTIEDPVEYRLPGINQVQVNAAAGVTFTTTLRSFLRQDPDIVLVGEIRDRDTAQVACQAALTGHLVLTTMHTNSSLQALIRLLDMGVEAYEVLPSVGGVMAQRLVRRLCPHCRQPYPVSRETMDRLFITAEYPDLHFFQAVGCAYCDNVGYKGRLAIHETLVVTEEMRNKLSRDPYSSAFETIAREHGFKPLRYDGLKKVMLGLTSLEEVERVTCRY